MWHVYLPASVLFFIILDAASSESSQGCVQKPANATARATGTDLWCYECKESYIKSYDPEKSPCRFNLSSVIVRQCGPIDRYCKVERLVLHQTVMSIERGCVEMCPYGCRYYGYGLTYKRCTSCCQTYACNEGNIASRRMVSWSLHCYVLLSWTWCLFSWLTFFKSSSTLV